MEAKKEKKNKKKQGRSNKAKPLLEAGTTLLQNEDQEYGDLNRWIVFKNNTPADRYLLLNHSMNKDGPKQCNDEKTNVVHACQDA